MRPQVFISRQKIRFDDVDGAGIVYYPRFFHLCHKAFEDAFNFEGVISYPQLIKEHKIGFPTVKVTGDFFKPIYYGDEIEVIFSVDSIGKSSVKTKFMIKNPVDSITNFTANITLVCMSLESRKSLEVPKAIRSFFERFLICNNHE
jgi:4-hydroxybenzoyl-CoA thioesterase